MTRSNKTEKLREELDKLFSDISKVEGILSNSILREVLVATILKACKESGLQFFFRRRHTNQIGEDWMIEGIDV